MKRRWIQRDGELIEVTPDRRPTPRLTIMPDLPGYQSPVTGLWVEGRKARREDLKRTGCRPWEGKAAELKEADRQRAYREERADRALDHAVRSAYYQLSPEKRRLFDH